MKKVNVQVEIKKMKELHDLSNKKKKLEQELQLVDFQISNKKSVDENNFKEEHQKLNKRITQTQLGVILATTLLVVFISISAQSNMYGNKQPIGFR